jgi:hypothetical protein
MPRKKPLKAPFVVTLSVAAAATFAAACGGKTSGVDDATPSTTNPPPPTPTARPDFPDSSNPPPPEPVCPQLEPRDGEYCPVWGQACEFFDRCAERPNGSPTNREFRCVSGRWQRQHPYLANCPAVMPTNGATCAPCGDEYPVECKYPNGSKDCPPALAACDPKSLTWQISISSCNPPPPDAGGGGP